MTERWTTAYKQTKLKRLKKIKICQPSIKEKCVKGEKVLFLKKLAQQLTKGKQKKL